METGLEAQLVSSGTPAASEAIVTNSYDKPFVNALKIAAIGRKNTSQRKKLHKCGGINNVQGTPGDKISYLCLLISVQNLSNWNIYIYIGRWE